jgi:hypothetical protein
MRATYTRVTGFVLLLCLVLPASARARQKPPQNDAELSMATIEALMQQLRGGLLARNADTVLAAFEPDQTPAFGQFAGNLRSFISRWDNILVHYQIIQVEKTDCGKGDCGAAQVQFQMEAESAQTFLPPLNRQAQVQLSIERTSKGWKIVNFSPRELFQ